VVTNSGLHLALKRVEFEKAGLHKGRQRTEEDEE